MALDPIDTKAPLASKGVWGGIIAILAGIAALYGYTISESDQAAITDLIVAVISAGGGILAIIGRLRAKRQIRT